MLARAPSDAAREDDARAPARNRYRLWAVAALSLTVGFAAWAAGAGFVAFWAFAVSSTAVALALPLPYAFVSPLYMGVAGWFVDMFPLLILVGWTAVVLRWMWGLLRDRRLPRAGWWMWLAAGLVAWTALGVVVVSFEDIRHFLLLFGIQFVISGLLVAVADALPTREDRIKVASALVAYVGLLSAAVFLQWIGVPVQDLQDDSISDRLEAAYGVDAFPNNTGMIKYTRAKEAGAGQLRRKLKALDARGAEVPPFMVFRPRLQAFTNRLVVRFEGSARHLERALGARDVELIYDNVGLAPMDTVPRLRSFPRNALTYAGICAAAFPFALYLAWTAAGRRRWLGRAGVAACLFGAAFSIARGAWVAILLGILYLIVDGVVSRRRKVAAIAIYAAAALITTIVFFVRYDSDPITARALGESSVATREELYTDTLESVTGVNLLLGYGTELPRTEKGTTRVYGDFGRYVPPAGTHSTYLNYLFRTGVPGLAAIVALYVVAWLVARRAARGSGDDRALATLSAVAVVIAAAHATILSLYVEPAYALAITLVLGLALAASHGGAVRPRGGSAGAEA